MRCTRTRVMQQKQRLEHTGPLSPRSAQYTVRELYQPVDDETIVHFDCIAAGAQTLNHSGVSAPIHNLCRHATAEEANAWIESNLQYDYVSVTLLIAVVERRYNADGVCDCETHSVRWVKYFHKDVPLQQ